MPLSDYLPKWIRAAKKEDAQAFSLTASVGFSDLEASAVDGEAPKRPSFEINAYTGAVMNIAGFYLPVVVDLAGLRAARGKLPILLDHDPSRIVGQGEATIDASGMRIKGMVTGDDSDAAKVVVHAKNGFEWQASIGASVVRREMLEAGKKAIVNGREVTGPLVIAREAIAQEVSFVAIGADGQTSASVAASSFKEGDGMNFEQWLAAKGYDPATISADLKTALQAAFNTEQGIKPDVSAANINAASKPGQVGNDQQAGLDHIASIRAEHARIAAVESACAKHPEIKAKAISEGWDADKAELAVLRASRANAPAIHVANNEIGADVIRAALATAGGLRDVEKQFDDKTLQAAHTHYKGRIGLRQVMLEAAWQGGYTGRHFEPTDSGIREVVRAAFSTTSLPGIFSNTANKFLLAGFTAVEGAWREVCSVRSVSDFKTHTSHRLTGAFEYEKVAPTGELKHGTVGEESYTNKAETYGKMFAITRVDIINDDLGALTVLPQRIGRGAALKLNDVFWAEFFADHTTFFPTNGSKLNYIEGAATALSSAGLQSATEMFRLKTDPDGKPLALDPKILLVGPSTEYTALELMRSDRVNTGGSSSVAKVPNINIWSGKYRPVVTTYLQNASYGNTSTGWYLLADPMDLSMIEVAFLNGQQQPTVESADAAFNYLGIEMRGFFDFGVNKQDHRAAVKSKGAA